MAQKQLLIFSWEYFGYHSAQGTALSKRPRQVAESFAANDWQVILIHRDNTGECGTMPFTINYEKSGVIRIPVKMLGSYDDNDKNALVRKLNTLFYVAFRGDRSYRWATDVIHNFHRIAGEVKIKPDYIISFYTPRGPLYLGHYFSAKLGVPWIADIQDPISSGIAISSIAIAARWMRNTLKTAKAIVHISPEWGSMDAALTGLKFDIIRHAIPLIDGNISNMVNDDLLKDYHDHFNVFYGGSLSIVLQSLELLRLVVERAAAAGIKVKIHLAGNENTLKNFKQGLPAENINYLGWINADLMNSYISNCDCTLVIPLSKDEIGVPSKFYELCCYPKPIWVIGYDTGAFISLFDEWQHPDIKIGDLEFQTQALYSAVKGDYSSMFNLPACKGPYLMADGLCREFSKLM